MSDQGTHSFVTVEKVDRCGLITLNRPEALNALNKDMIDAMEAFYLDCLKDPHIYGVILESNSEKAFCAGGDVRGLVEMMPEQAELVRDTMFVEFQHNWTLQQFNKPSVPLIDGVVIGGGAGISLYGTHCVMTEHAKFAMPEVNIGFFPDVGSSYILSRLPGKVGLYLALTGQMINSVDCRYLGIATHTISSDKFDDIKTAMIDAQPIDIILDGMQQEFGRSEFIDMQETIDKVFSGDSLEQIFKNLDGEGEDGWSKYSDWAREIEELLRGKCPLSLKITFEQFKRAESYKSLKEALITDMRIASRVIENPDFKEGVRAALIEKTNDPKWSHASIEDVKDDDVSSYFLPLPDEREFADLKL